MEGVGYFTSKRGQSYHHSADSTPNQQTGYCPFRTPILHSRLHDIGAPLKSCRVLFQEDEDSVLNELDSNIPRKDEIGAMDGIAAFGKLIVKEKKNHNGLLPSSETKENSISYEPFSFNARMRVKYPQTPIFKKILESPIPQFNRMFQWRTDTLKNQIRRKVPVTAVDCKSNPLLYKDCGYKFFMCLAEYYKKLHAVAECRIFYKISIYMQPYDESTWEWVLKFEQELGSLETAYSLCKTAVMFLKNENFIIKYLKLADKLDKSMEEVRGVLGQVALKFQQVTKVYLQLAKLQYKFGETQTAYKICHYLLQETDGNSSVILEIAKILECANHVPEAILTIYQSIEKGCKAYSVYSLYLKLLESVYYYGNDHIEYILSRAEKSLPQEVLWKLVLDVSRYYSITQQKEQYLYLIKKALVVAPSNSKLKPYTLIQKSRQAAFAGNSKNSLLSIQSNKQGFIKGKMNFYNFSEWKHFLHYSLFYTFYGIQEARVKLEEASVKWPYAGRLWAEIIWVMRVSKQDALSKWKEVIAQVPKSGEVWCEGGRIFAEKGDLDSAMFCFESAIHLTPQYGDSFIQAMKILMIKGNYKQLKVLKRKILNFEPFYGNVWCFLKDHPRSSTIEIYRRAKYLLQQQLYRHSSNYRDSLTAIEQYDYLFQHPQLVSQVMKEKIICAYDQLENTRC